MIKVAVLDDYQEVFQQIIDIEKFKGKYENQIFLCIFHFQLFVEIHLDNHLELQL